MKFDKRKRVHLAASRPGAPTRFATDTVRFELTRDEGRGRLIATDGRILAVVHGKTDEKDEPCKGASIPVEAVKLACNGKQSARADVVCGLTTVATHQGDIKTIHPREDVLEFPDWEAAIPDPKRAIASVKIDAKRLWRLAQALGSDGPIELEIGDDGCPALVRTLDRSDRDYGVIMPMGEVSRG